MDRTKKVFISFTFILCCLAVSLLAAALGTDYWVISSPVRNNSKPENVSIADSSGKVNFGLFHGSKILNYGLGEEGRKIDLWTTCEVLDNICFLDVSVNLLRTRLNFKNLVDLPTEASKSAALFSFGLWIVTIIFIGLAMIFGLLGAFFAIINIVTRPIEVITGFNGLFVWNGFAAIFSCLAVVIYVILFYDKLNERVLDFKEIDNNWTSKNLSQFGYSFWIVLASMLIYFLNILILIMSNVHLKPLPYKADMNDKSPNSMMMY